MTYKPPWLNLILAVLTSLTLAPALVAAAEPFEKPADWKTRPSPESIAEVFPTAAWSLNLSGRVMLYCTVTAGGRLDPCAIADETPNGLGFGKAAIALSKTFEFHPAVAKGAPIASQVRIPITFALPPEDRPAATRPAPAADQRLAATFLGALSSEEMVDWMLGENFQMISDDPAVDEPLRSAATGALFQAALAGEASIRAATRDAYAAYLSKAKLEALIAWSKGDRKAPPPAFDEAEADRIGPIVAAAIEPIRTEAGRRFCELIVCRVQEDTQPQTTSPPGARYKPG